MDSRRGKKSRLHLCARRKSRNNIAKFNRCRKMDLPCLTKSLLGIANITSRIPSVPEDLINERTDIGDEVQICKQLNVNLHTKTSPPNELNVKRMLNDKTEESIMVEGVRLIHFQHFLESLITISSHGSAFGCTISNLNIVKEDRYGLQTIITFKCNMCGYKVAIPLCKEEPNQVDINTAAVIGSVNIGAGFTQLQSFTSSLDIPPMSYKMFARAHETACNAWESLAWETMKEAAKEESLIAIQSGSVDEDGIPMITVVCDGSWAKRSYRGGGNYNSLSGTAAIIGFNTKKILYIGIKNKYCIICQRAENTRSIPKSHVCYKNWHGSSTAMESAIIADGFCKSVEMYNLIYSKMIADGDSSAYRKILDRKPYKNCVVEKIECRNHLLRNYCNKLKEFAKSRNLPTILRNIINENIIRARSAVVKAIKYRKEEKCTASEQIINLRKDILNSLSHILGEHKKCQNLQYFCNKSSPDARNIIEDIEILGLSDKLNQIVRHLASHSKSLIMNVDTNTVEQFNSIIVKYTGGKRINLTMRRSYQGRCMAAVVSRNTKRPVYYTHKYLNEGASPGKNLVSVEAKKAERLLQATKRPRKKLNLKNCSVGTPDKDYGPECQRNDLDEETMKMEMNDFINKLNKSEEEYAELEKRTVLQSDCNEWLQQRKKLLMASTFGQICKMRASTSCKSIVKSILYREHISAKAIMWGNANEKHAIHVLHLKLNTNIKNCGIFINKRWPYLGATPDGITADDSLVEVKCPYSAREMNIAEAVDNKIILFIEKCEDGYLLKKNHNYYYQVQGQLNISNREKCYFVVWTLIDFIFLEIYRDKNFFENCMLPKLRNFFFECLLPEIIDPRHTRNLEIRDPPYIVNAKKTKKSSSPH